MGVDFTPPRQNGIEALSNCLVYLLALYMIIGFPDAGMGVLRMLGPSPKPMGTANVFEGRAERKKRGWKSMRRRHSGRSRLGFYGNYARERD